MARQMRNRSPSSAPVIPPAAPAPPRRRRRRVLQLHDPRHSRQAAPAPPRTAVPELHVIVLPTTTAAS